MYIILYPNGWFYTPLNRGTSSDNAGLTSSFMSSFLWPMHGENVRSYSSLGSFQIIILLLNNRKKVPQNVSILWHLGICRGHMNDMFASVVKRPLCAFFLNCFCWYIPSRYQITVCYAIKKLNVISVSLPVQATDLLEICLVFSLIWM